MPYHSYFSKAIAFGRQYFQILFIISKLWEIKIKLRVSLINFYKTTKF